IPAQPPLMERRPSTRKFLSGVPSSYFSAHVSGAVCVQTRKPTGQYVLRHLNATGNRLPCAPGFCAAAGSEASTRRNAASATRRLLIIGDRRCGLAYGGRPRAKIALLSLAGRLWVSNPYGRVLCSIGSCSCCCGRACWLGVLVEPCPV